MSSDSRRHAIFYCNSATDESGQSVDNCFVKLFDDDMRLQDVPHPSQHPSPLDSIPNGTHVIGLFRDGRFVIEWSEEIEHRTLSAPSHPIDAFLKMRNEHPDMTFSLGVSKAQ